jgi:2'-5' RNA ligase
VTMQGPVDAVSREPVAPHDQARLFIALWPPAELQVALHDWCIACCLGAHVHPVAAVRLHLTLHFLGTVPRQRLPELVGGLHVPFEPFELRFSFNHCERWARGVVVALPEAAPPPLAILHGALGRSARALGLPTDERPFRPHVTLARRHSGAFSRRQPIEGTAALRWPVRGYVLVESQPGPPSAYRPLCEFS